jgi:secondary thiamine-phosphate synthase enzyme
MVHYTDEIKFKTKGEVTIKDITSEVAKVIKASKVRHGTVTVFHPGSTGVISTIEYEPGLVQDLEEALERLFPKDLNYKHHLKWSDGNGHSHIRATFLGPSLVVPIIDGAMTLGQWQQIIFIDLDVRPRERKVIVQVMGE